MRTTYSLVVMNHITNEQVFALEFGLDTYDLHKSMAEGVNADPHSMYRAEIICYFVREEPANDA